MNSMKIRVTINLDRADESVNDSLGSLESGSFGVDKDGVYRMFYHNRSNLVEFEDVEIVETV